jgi:hypothetical protein
MQSWCVFVCERERERQTSTLAGDPLLDMCWFAQDLDSESLAEGLAEVAALGSPPVGGAASSSAGPAQPPIAESGSKRSYTSYPTIAKDMPVETDDDQVLRLFGFVGVYVCVWCSIGRRCRPDRQVLFVSAEESHWRHFVNTFWQHYIV